MRRVYNLMVQTRQWDETSRIIEAAATAFPVRSGVRRHILDFFIGTVPQSRDAKEQLSGHCTEAFIDTGHRELRVYDYGIILSYRADCVANIELATYDHRAAILFAAIIINSGDDAGRREAESVLRRILTGEA